MIGQVVGNYKVVDKIGEGGMGAVFKGIDLMLEREVAIKVLKPELANQPQVVERFRSEAVTLAKLNHPNIATLYNFFRQGDYFFMVLEYVNGVPLDRIIEAHGTLTCEQAIPLFCQMLEGIDHAHAFGIVHRDIKPANMMLTEAGLLKVLDFGIARALGSARMTRAGHLIGTIEYMSPEQVRGLNTDARSDIYSLGMVLYEMLTGRVPFASDSEFELMRAQVEQLPTPPREFAPSIPEEVEWAILCSTEKDPAKRFQTAGAFGEAIVDSVNTAISTGALSQVHLRRSTSRFGTSALSGEKFSPHVSSHSTGGRSQSSSISVETAPASSENGGYTPPTRFAPTNQESPAALSLKATRMGDPSEYGVDRLINPALAGSALKRSSIFGELNRKHYILGGAVLGVFFIGFLAIAVAAFLRGGASNADSGGTSIPSSSPAAEEITPYPSKDDEESPSVKEPQREADSRYEAAQTSPASEESQNNNTPIVVPTESPKVNKTARTNVPTRKKPRSSRDIMGIP